MTIYFRDCRRCFQLATTNQMTTMALLQANSFIQAIMYNETEKKLIESNPDELGQVQGRHVMFKRVGLLLPFLAGVIATTVLFVCLGNLGDYSGSIPLGTAVSSEREGSVPVSRIRSLGQLLAMEPAQLEQVDIGLMNLLCATGLNGSEGMDNDKCLATLDQWAEHVRKDTEARIHNFYKNRTKYYNSIAVFRMTHLVLAIKEDFGIQYNLENTTHTDYKDSREIFIYSMLSGEHGGSCTNLPVMCVAIARRLGYPIKLVEGSEHLFARWDDEKTGEKFNIESACPAVNIYDDEHYRNWPRKMNELDLKRGYLLKSLTPAEELALFLNLRGTVLADTGRIAEAQVAFANSYRYNPDSSRRLVDLAATVDRELNKVAELDYQALGRPVRYMVGPSKRAEDSAKMWRWSYPPTGRSRNGLSRSK